MQDAVVTANHEITQLRAATSALRDALEHEQRDKERGVQAAVRTAQDEIKQLKETVAALRDTLEGASARA